MSAMIKQLMSFCIYLIRPIYLFIIESFMEHKQTIDNFMVQRSAP